MPSATSSQVTDMFREPSSPASMRMRLRSLCHSSVGASASRLTSTGGVLADLGADLIDDQVHEPARNDDLLDDRLAVEMALNVLAPSRQLGQLRLGGVGRDLEPVAELAVDLHDQHVGVALEQCRVGFRPGLLPDPLALQPLIDLRAEVGGEREEQGGGGGCAETDGCRSGLLLI